MQTRIVVVDNDLGTQDLFAVSLRQEGYQVFGYTYDQITIPALQQLLPDLIILDFNSLSEGMGWECLQILKMEDATAKIPIIISTIIFQLTADIEDYLLTRYIKVVHKPFDLVTFLPLVRKTLMEASQSSLIFSGDRTLPILVVDDNEDLRDTVITILRFEGHHVVSASNGQIALDNVSRAEFSLILLDIAMPIMNGHQFLDAYAHQLRPHTPVIVFTAEGDIHLRSYPSFVVSILSKPLQLKPFLKIVEQYAQPIRE
jgi:CheY-like chemotaxis protein